MAIKECACRNKTCRLEFDNDESTECKVCKKRFESMIDPDGREEMCPDCWWESDERKEWKRKRKEAQEAKQSES